MSADRSPQAVLTMIENRLDTYVAEVRLARELERQTGASPGYVGGSLSEFHDRAKRNGLTHLADVASHSLEELQKAAAWEATRVAKKYAAAMGIEPPSDTARPLPPE